MRNEIPEYVDGLPNICGAEDRLATALREGRTRPVFVAADTAGFGDIESTFAIALHGQPVRCSTSVRWPKACPATIRGIATRCSTR